MAQKFSGFNVPQAWDSSANYQGGQGGQLVTHAGLTWRALRPHNTTPPGTISGQWEVVPSTITSPNQAATPSPTPAPAPKPAPTPYPPISATFPIQVNGTRISIKALGPSGTNHSPGYAPDTPAIAGSTKFLREDATWAVPGVGPGGTVTSVGLALPASVFTVSGSPVIAAGTLTGTFATQTANTGFFGPTTGVPAAPTFRAIVPADLAGTPGAGKYWDGTGTWTTLPAPGTGTVTSVAMTVPTELAVGGSPITSSGTLALSWNSEAQHAVFAGPSGGSGTPTFRALVSSDIPALSYVTSVGLSLPSIITVSGSPVTSVGTLTGTLATQSANLVWAGPTTGIASTPTFRSVVPADLAGTPGAGKYWDGAGSGAWTTLPAPGTGTVTSVAMTVPTELSVSGSPVTTSGTLGLTWNSEAQHAVFAGPSGSAGTPTFRALVASDIPALSYVTSVALTAPAEITVGGSPITGSGTLALTWANESANKVLAGPTSGGATTPNFRSIVPLDLASGGTAANFYRGDGVFASIPGSVNTSAIVYAYNTFT